MSFYQIILGARAVREKTVLKAHRTDDMDDQTPELGGAGEGAEDLELELETSPEEGTPTEPNGDPLDDIQDPVARAEAKKNRAIARRTEKTVVAPTANNTQDFLKRSDFHKANERKAIRIATADPEVKAAWSEIVQYYTPRSGKETPEDILEDIQDAITVFKSRNATVEKDDSADQLQTTAVVKTGGGVSVATPPKTPNPPNFKLPTQPKDWYSVK